MNSFQEVWQRAYQQMSENLSAVAVKTWISCMQPLELNMQRALFLVPSNFQKEIIVSRYLDTIKNYLADTLGFSVEIEIETEEDRLEAEEAFSAPEAAQSAAPAANLTAQIDREYTFDNFIVGNANKFAHAASVAVANAPAAAYNPLFIYGGSGLGKTHLLYAIANEIKKKYPAFKVVYLRGEVFTNELIESIRNSTVVEFRNKYRFADVLLMDDIQFIGGKESTQEEFFHTFNTLHAEKKQIVLTSDRPPKEIQTLDDRLRTRFEWGLIADIQPPDLETRSAIIIRKAKTLGLDLPADVTDYIAGKLKNNIRQLEGAVKKISAYVALGERITVDLAATAIRDILSDQVPVSVLVERIVEDVARYYNLEPDDLRSKKRTAEVALARQVAMYIIREGTDLSLTDIGDVFGGRNHATVLYAIREVEGHLERDVRMKNMITDVMASLNA